jgi:DNA-binding CsgD family transcriptional regulator
VVVEARNNEHHAMPRLTHHAPVYKYLQAVDRLLTVDSLDAFKNCLVQEIRSLLGFGCVVGGMGRIVDGQLVPEVLVHHDFPADYLRALRQPTRTVHRPILNHWLATQVPVAFAFNSACDQLLAKALAEVRHFDLINVLAHGHCAPADGLLTYFSFHRFAAPVTQEQGLLLARLMPHIHCAVGRLHTPRVAPPAIAPTRLDALSPRQQEIATWLTRGKTNWEISQITGTSESNVKYHLSNLMRAHAVNTRAGLVFRLCHATEAPPRLPV